jgi:hypothetical protein
MSAKRTRLDDAEKLLEEIKNDLLLNKGRRLSVHIHNSIHPEENSECCLRCRILAWTTRNDREG